mgnify:CR=1 FL=1
MKINVDRLCALAGLPATTSAQTLNESAQEEGRYMEEEADVEEAHCGEGSDMLEDDDELLEVDEAVLVQELRRMKQMMAESNQKKVEAEKLQESQLRSIIEEEIKNLVKEMNLTASWIYGDKKPKNSKKGVINTTFGGPGFR